MPMTANRVQVTKTTVDRLIAKAKREGRTLFARDAELGGFGVYATAGGTASYFIEYKIGGRAGKTTRFPFARHGADKTPDQARREALILKAEAKRGVDPLASRRAAKARLTAESFAKACERYLALNGKGKRSWGETRRILEKDAVLVLGSRAVPTITKADVRGLIDGVSQRAPVAARALFKALRLLFAWCAERGLIEHSPMAHLRSPDAPEARERVLTDEEIRVFWRAAGEMGWPFGPMLCLCLLTGQRRDEVAGMRWREIDAKSNAWTIPAARAKNKKAHVVHLSPQALAILETLPKWTGSDLAFTTNGKTSISGFSKAKARLDGLMSEAIGEPVSAWRIHDLRRTMATGLQAMGIGLEVTERALNHVAGKTTGGLHGVYQRHEFIDERRDALLAWGRRVECIVSEEALGANVVPLRAAR